MTASERLVFDPTPEPAGRPPGAACAGRRRLGGPLTALLACVSGATAATHTVNPAGTGDYPTIQAAVTAAAAGDTIALTDGVFTGPGNHNIDPEGKAVVVRSQGGAPEACIIDCQGSESTPRRAFYFHSWEDADCVVEAITIRNGYGLVEPYGASGGGAIVCDFASPTIRGCVFSANEAFFGAAILVLASSWPRIEACTFTGNHAVLDGAGVDCRETAAPHVVDCLFVDNVSDHRAGGIIADEYASPIIEGCTFIGNHAEDGGGGGYSCGTADPIFRHCTFYANSAGVNGAGLSASCHGFLFVESCIIAFSTSGEAVTCLNDAEATLTCCDLYGNAGGDWVGFIAPQYGVNGNFAQDPLFCDAPGSDLRLHGESPCLPRNHPHGEEGCGVLGAWGVGCPDTGADPRSLAEADTRGLRLGLPHPNPFRARVTFDLEITGATQIAGDSPVTLFIHDASGRVVRTLLRRGLEPGTYRRSWNGRDDRGAALPAGIYYGSLRCGDRMIARPLLRLR